MVNIDPKFLEMSIIVTWPKFFIPFKEVN